MEKKNSYKVNYWPRDNWAQDANQWFQDEVAAKACAQELKKRGYLYIVFKIQEIDSNIGGE